MTKIEFLDDAVLLQSEDGEHVLRNPDLIATLIGVLVEKGLIMNLEEEGEE